MEYANGTPGVKLAARASALTVTTPGIFSAPLERFMFAKLSVVTSMGSLKTTETTVFVAIFIEFSAGATETTVGGAVSTELEAGVPGGVVEASSVVKLQVFEVAREFPARSLTEFFTVTRYFWEFESVKTGVSTSVFSEYVVEAGIGFPETSDIRNDSPVTVDESMNSEKLTVMRVDTEIFVESSSGMTPAMVGGAVSNSFPTSNET